MAKGVRLGLLRPEQQPSETLVVCLSEFELIDFVFIELNSIFLLERVERRQRRCCRPSAC